MSDEFTKAVCKAVQQIYYGQEEGEGLTPYFCEYCDGEAPIDSTYHGDIVHKEDCIVPLTWEYLNPNQPVEEPTYCSFSVAWVGSCGRALPCHEHDNQLCSTSGCSNIATYSCEHTSQFVCGAPHCGSHRCNHGR